MNHKLPWTKAFFALTAAMLLSAVAVKAAEPAETPKPAIELGTPFADNAILQRQMQVPVWGWSKPGTKITVEFAGQKKTATTGSDGKWMLKLDALKANATPAEMLISDNGGRKVTLKNILVGEVWLASGQSNMQWIASKSSCRNIIKALAEKGETPPIREAKVTNYFAALHPIEHAEGAWSDGSSFDNYSAIAFAFAHKLYEELGVPIGILNCSFSQTSIEAWTPRVGFAAGKDEYTRSVYQKILETDPKTPEHRAAWSKYFHDIEQTVKENAQLVKKGEEPNAISIKTPGNLSGNRDATWLFNARLNPMIPYAVRGGVWNQGYANMGAGITYYDNLHSMIRGWRQLWDRPELPVYFHQFYCPGKGTDVVSIGSTSEMRLGTWLARDIPNANMASQIDITGAIHYGSKAVPGQRLALHALKNQYGKKIVAEGPMFKSYKVDANKLIVDFEHAEGGLVVAETGSNAIGKQEGATGFANPTVIPNGDDQVTLFYLADENRVWHRASMRIDGDKVVVTAPKVKSPKGVAYGTGSIGFWPNLYNRSLLPMTPFIYYEHKLVTSATWPDDPIKIADVVLDPSEGGKLYEYRKMPLLSTQFRNNAVLQAGVPLTFFGSAIHDWGYEADGEAVIKFSFGDVQKSIPVTAGMKEWRYTAAPMQPTATPRTLKVALEIDGEVVHERVCENIVLGDVWFVAVPMTRPKVAAGKSSGGIVRVIQRKAKRSMSPRPSRYTIAVSSTPLNRFASTWDDASGGFAAALGHRIAAKTGNPVGIVFVQGQAPLVVDGKTRGSNLDLKHWMVDGSLQHAPSLQEDYKQLATVKPGNSYYDSNAARYVADWKKYWRQFIPQMIATKSVPNGEPWGTYPSLSSSVTTNASQAYNVMVHSFGPGSFKGIIFVSSENMVAGEKAAHFGSELSALANGWKGHFEGDDTPFYYTIPSKALAPKTVPPKQIKGKSRGVEINNWSDNMGIEGLIDQVIKETY